MPRALRKRRLVTENEDVVVTPIGSPLRVPKVLTALGRHPFPMRRLLSRNPPSHLNGTTVYRARSSDLLMGHYKVLVGLGYGGYGTVVKAEDNVTGTVVAIKLLHRDEERQQDTALEQLTYRRLVEGCDPRVNLFAEVLGSGNHDGFHCIVFELCHGTLLDILRGFSGLAPLPGRHIMEMAYQMLSGICYLHSLGIIHTDLKPDNIAVKCPDTTTVQWFDPVTGFHEKRVLVAAQICILDLGAVVDAILPAGNMGRVSTRQYRAIEVSLGLPWSYGIDTFALGCVISELYLVDVLFSSDVDSDQEHLATWDKLVGPFPTDYALNVENEFPGTFVFDGPTAVVKYPSREDSVTDLDHVEALRRLEEVKPISARVHNSSLCDLIRKLTHPDPSARIQLGAAVKHRYFDALSILQMG
ncbi:kinase-like protein [Lenzites betulinus]|nr:kinase-like protein [Lenzites betulinus]